MVRRETGGGSNSCTSCGRRGHTAGRCRVGSSGGRGSRHGTLASPQVSRHHSHPEPSVAHLFLYVTFPEFSQHKAPVDSGAPGNFVDRALAYSLGIPIVPVAVPFPVHALDSQPLRSGLIREATATLGMVTQGGQKKRISLFLIDSPAIPVELGLPWLACHNPITPLGNRGQQRALAVWSRE